MLVDLHTHTRFGSNCSYMEPRELAQAARAAGLDAVCITEHDLPWSSEDLGALSREQGFLCLGGMEVATAGNSINSGGAGDSVIYPAKYSSVIAVAATAGADSWAWWSSTGDAVELAAPGVGIYSTWKNGEYNTISGTSMASPHVAGSAALAVASGLIADTNGNSRINDEVQATLQATADDLGTAGVDPWYGYGLVDAEETVTGVETLP